MERIRGDSLENCLPNGFCLMGELFCVPLANCFFSALQHNLFALFQAMGQFGVVVVVHGLQVPSDLGWVAQQR